MSGKIYYYIIKLCNAYVMRYLKECESRQGLWILSHEEAIQLAHGTTVVLLRCPFVSEIMQGRAQGVFLNK
jgi:hypothetical protein